MSTPVTTSAPQPTPLTEFAWSDWSSHTRLWITAAMGLGIDLYTKWWAFEVMKDRIIVIPSALSLQNSYNTGALWGMGKHKSQWFVLASVLALGFVMYVFAKSTALQRWFHVSLGMIVAGALGNLHDRIFVQIQTSAGMMGAVRDFIKIELKIGSMELWPWIFNVADMLLVVGVGILMITMYRTPHQSTVAVSNPSREETNLPIQSN